MNEPTVSVSCSMKLNLGNYESAEVFLSVAGIAADSTPDQIDAALATGKLAYDRIRERVRAEVAALRGGDSSPVPASSTPRERGAPWKNSRDLAAEAEALSTAVKS